MNKVVTCTLVAGALLIHWGFAQQPQWWVESGLVNSSPRQDNAAATLGQAKHVVQQAYVYVNDVLQPVGGAGEEVTALYQDLCLTPPADPLLDQQPLTFGQLKYIGKPFYDLFNAPAVAWDTTAINPDSGSVYPWSLDSPQDSSGNLVALAQLKLVFSFDLSDWAPTKIDLDQDGLPDEWEQQYLQTLDYGPDDILIDGGLTLAQAYDQYTDPTVLDSDADGWSDAQELAWGWLLHEDQSLYFPRFGPDGDFDGDGISNLNESWSGTDPTDVSDAPPRPPVYYTTVIGRASELRIEDISSNNQWMLMRMLGSHAPANYARWHRGQLTLLSPGESAYALSINSSGIVVGQAEHAYGFAPVFWHSDKSVYEILPGTITSGGADYISDITDDNIICGRTAFRKEGDILYNLGMTGDLIHGFTKEIGELTKQTTSRYPYYKWVGTEFNPVGMNENGGLYGSRNTIFVSGAWEYDRNVYIAANGDERKYEGQIIALNETGHLIVSEWVASSDWFSSWYQYSLVLPSAAEVDLQVDLFERVDSLSSPSSANVPLMILTNKRLMIQKSRVGESGQRELMPISSSKSFDHYDLGALIGSEQYEMYLARYKSPEVDMSPDGQTISIQATDTTTGIDQTLLLQLLKVDLVPDYDRDGKIDDSDRGKVTDSTPYRWWLNDDDDISEVEGKDAPGDGSADYNNAVVDTARDLVDFFPVFIDLESLLSSIDDLSTLEVKLKHADGSLKFFYTDLLPEDSKDYWYESGLTTGYGSDFTDAPGEADTIAITSSGVALSEAFLNQMKNDDKGVILLEGAGSSESTEPLVLEVSVSGTKLFDFEMPLKVSPVTDMFRHVNLAEYVGTSETYADATGEPSNNPDSLSNGKHFAFIHGYNVSQDAAKGWHCEIFKRMHQMGSKAKFIGVTWDGDTSPDYHNAVYRAFKTSAEVAGELGGFSDLTIAAHSLGNMVISNAMENHGFDPDRYYLLNAATPIEAYNQLQTTNSSGNVDMDEYMTESDWKDYPDRVYMSNWYELFPTSDARSELTWKDRFSNIVDKSYNFYSPGEDVVENAGDNESVTSALLGTLSAWITGESIGTHAWVTNEIAKGGKNIGTITMLAERHGGWDLNGAQNDLEQVGIKKSFPADSDSYRPRLASETSATVPTDEQLAQFGFFSRLNEYNGEKLYAPVDDANVLPGITQTQSGASNLAAADDVQWHLLAEAIPTMSFAAAANNVEGMQGNYNMMVNAVGWPASRGNNNWRHSDFKNVSLNYVRTTFEEMINIGGLDND